MKVIGINGSSLKDGNTAIKPLARRGSTESNVVPLSLIGLPLSLRRKNIPPGHHTENQKFVEHSFEFELHFPKLLAIPNIITNFATVYRSQRPDMG